MIAVVSIAVRTLYSSRPLSLQYSASVNAAIEAVDPGCLPPLITPLMSERQVGCVFAWRLNPFTELADGTTWIDDSRGGKNGSVKLKNYRFSDGKRKQKEATSRMTPTQAEHVLCFGHKAILHCVKDPFQRFFNLLFHWLTTDPVTNEFPATQPADSLLAQWTFSLQSHPVTPPPVRFPNHPPLLLRPTAECLVICNGNVEPWVKVTLCQRVILRLPPGHRSLAVLFM